MEDQKADTQSGAPAPAAAEAQVVDAVKSEASSIKEELVKAGKDDLAKLGAELKSNPVLSSLGQRLFGRDLGEAAGFLAKGTTLKFGGFKIHLAIDTPFSSDDIKDEQTFVEAAAHHAEEFGAHVFGLNAATLENAYNRVGQLINPPAPAEAE